jgi:hypothetical protein
MTGRSQTLSWWLEGGGIKTTKCFGSVDTYTPRKWSAHTQAHKEACKSEKNRWNPTKMKLRWFLELVDSMTYPHKVHSTTVSVPLSELGPPLPQACPSAGTKGVGHTRPRVRGWGSPNSDDWRKGLALCTLSNLWVSPTSVRQCSLFTVCTASLKNVRPSNLHTV